MADGEEYIEVDAVVRMPRGERLADSRKTEGWSRGFTPKSTDKGPEHVEIRLKGQDQGSGHGGTASPDPEFIYIHEYIESPRMKTREEEELDELFRLVVVLGLIKAAEWAQPRLRRLWNDQVGPYFKEKREQWQARLTRRKAARRPAAQPSPSVIERAPAEELNEVSQALNGYEANMTSDEARHHLTQLLIAQYFVNEKKRLLANARIDDGRVSPELANAVQALTPGQAAGALDSILATRPSLIDDLGVLLEAGRSAGPLELENGPMTMAVRLIHDEQD